MNSRNLVKASLMGLVVSVTLALISAPVSAQTEEAKLTASDAAVGDVFGFAVSISGNRAIIGAHQDQEAGPLSGSAYIFRRDGTTWVEEASPSAERDALINCLLSLIAALGS